MEKPALLFLAHRIPYPPNKGDKIRSFHMLQALAAHYRIYLGAFVDDADDWRYPDALNEYCEEIQLLGLTRWHKLLSVRGLLTGQALSIPYYSRGTLQNWVDQTLEKQGIKRVFVFSSAMAQFVSGEKYRPLHRVIDFVDVDSEKWREYSQMMAWPMSGLYGREGRRLLDYDRQIAGEFDASLFVSDSEAQLFSELTGHTENIHFINNGVNADYFSRQHALENPYPADAQVLVFTGAMDYWANVDAVCWFADKIFSLVRAKLPQICFYIVGGKPTSKVIALGDRPGIHVTGRVEDIRPWLRFARVAVAPMRIARGIQNKVLEAMAMEIPVVATRNAMEGITPVSQQSLRDDAAGFAASIVQVVIDADAKNLGTRGRQLVVTNFNWETNLGKLTRLLD